MYHFGFLFKLHILMALKWILNQNSKYQKTWFIEDNSTFHFFRISTGCFCTSRESENNQSKSVRRTRYFTDGFVFDDDLDAAKLLFTQNHVNHLLSDSVDSSYNKYLREIWFPLFESANLHFTKKLYRAYQNSTTYIECPVVEFVTMMRNWFRQIQLYSQIWQLNERNTYIGIDLFFSTEWSRKANFKLEDTAINLNLSISNNFITILSIKIIISCIFFQNENILNDSSCDEP